MRRATLESTHVASVVGHDITMDRCILGSAVRHFLNFSNCTTEPTAKSVLRKRTKTTPSYQNCSIIRK